MNKAVQVSIFFSKISFFLSIFWPVLVLAGETHLHLVRPYTHSTLKITKQVSGVCEEQSWLIKREDAWHCEAGGQSYDPCFTKQYTNQRHVLCLNSPWSSEATQILLTNPLKQREHLALDMSKTYPWAVQLDNGVRCFAAEPGYSYDNMPVRFYCEDKHILVGHLQRCSPEWKILHLHPAENNTSTVKLAHAWF